MGSDAAKLRSDLEIMRRDGSVVVRFGSAEEAGEWRAAIRKACRAAGLRVRTGTANADAATAWAYHVDHVVTEAARQAAARAMDAFFGREERKPFHELVREEQRKMLRVVPPGAS